MSTAATTNAENLANLVDTLVRELERHEQEAQRIRDTLADLRKKLATTPGARAGKNARRGRRRTRTEPVDTQPAIEAVS